MLWLTNLEPVSCHRGRAVSLCNVSVFFFCVFFPVITASRWVCKPRAHRVHLWTAQRPHPASMGNISRYKGAEFSSDTFRAHIQYKQCLSHRRRTSAQGCILFMVRPSHPCGVLTGTVMWKCIRLSRNLHALSLCFGPWRRDQTT